MVCCHNRVLFNTFQGREPEGFRKEEKTLSVVRLKKKKFTYNEIHYYLFKTFPICFNDIVCVIVCARAHLLMRMLQTWLVSCLLAHTPSANHTPAPDDLIWAASRGSSRESVFAESLLVGQ